MHRISPELIASQEWIPEMPHGDMARSFRGDNLNSQVFPGLVAMRTDFVRQMGWPLKGEKDGDEYDSLTETKHYFAEGDLGEIRSTMRLTEVDSIEGALSLKMLLSNLEMHESARQHLVSLSEKDPRLRIFDLTRLVFDPGVRPDEMPDLMLRMFVPAMMETALGSDSPESTIWVFSVMRGMGRALRGMGVDFESVTTGRVSQGDEYMTEFGLIRPFEATMTALDSDEPRHELARNLIMRGLEPQKSL